MRWFLFCAVKLPKNLSDGLECGHFGGYFASQDAMIAEQAVPVKVRMWDHVAKQ